MPSPKVATPAKAHRAAQTTFPLALTAETDEDHSVVITTSSYDVVRRAVRYTVASDSAPGGEVVIRNPIHVEPAIEQSGWQDLANCLGVDPDLFFPERGASTREAKEVCRGCVVRAECLEYALVHGEKFGIWGGMSERERRRIRRARAIAQRASQPA